jgi:RHS repeat-associated protein
MGWVSSSAQTPAGGSAYSFNYCYNASGTLASETYPSSRAVSYIYDAAGRVSSVSGSFSGTTKDYAGPSNTPISYAPQGAIASMRLGNSLTETRTYNARLQTSGVQLGTNGSVLGLSYTYPSTSNNGSVGGIAISGAGLSGTINQTFGYDGFNRLNSFSETGGTANQNYGYDNLGNRWISGGWVNPAYSAQTPQSNVFNSNRWSYTPGSTCDGTGAVQYDCAGNQTSVWLGGSSYRTFTYDAEGRVLTATVPGMSAISYAYDGNGARVQKTVGSMTTTYIYDAQGQLAEQIGGPTNPYAGTTTYLTSDALGSIRAVTNGAATVLARYDYAPFGEELNSGMDGRSSPFLSNQYPMASSDGTELKFIGEMRDVESGLDWFESRYYSFSQGRFTGSDEPLAGSYSDNPQSWHLISYGLNNPLAFVDPSGHDPCENGVDPDTGNFCTTGTAAAPSEPESSPDTSWLLDFMRPIFQTWAYGAEFAQQTVTAIQNFRQSPNCAAGLTIGGAALGAGAGAYVGGAAGGAAGFVGGSVVPIAGNAAGLVGGAALGSVGGALVGASLGGAVGAAGGSILCSSGTGAGGSSRPQPSNRSQNKTFRDAVREVQRRIGRSLSQDEQRRLHDAITGQNLGYWGIVEEGEALFGAGAKE